MKQRQWVLAKVAGACLLSSLGSYAHANVQCDYQDLTQNQAWIERVASAEQSCYRSWFNAPSEAALTLYSETSLTAIAQRLSTEVDLYRAEKEQAKRIANMSEFLKAAYYARYATQVQYGYFSQSFSRSIADISQRFIRSGYATELGREQTQAMASITLLIDSVKQLPVAMDSMLTLLESFDRQNAQNLQYVDGLNNLFRAMHGHVSRGEFYTDMLSHPEYLARLQRFVDNNLWALGTDSEFLVYNAVRETGRLLARRNQALNQQVMPFLEQVMAQHGIGTQGEKLWLAAAEMILFYAPDKAKDLDIETSKAQLEQRLMAHRFECQGPAIIRSQNLTQQQAQHACDILNDKEADFHQVVNSGQIPVADDNNSQVEVVVWQDNAAYTTYSNFLFGNSTDNGGQYLEGNPRAKDNVARFIAYRYASDELAILNLEHEYVHYLDGRFNLYGGFDENLRQGHIVWWLEGFAEYMHYKKGYQAAVDLIGLEQYSLSEIFATTYQHDVNRVYRWGYLAVRFMFEHHPTEVDTLLQYARAGNYLKWAEEVTSLGVAFDQEFSAWLDTVANDPSGNDNEVDDIEQPNVDQITSLALNHTQSFSAQAYQEHLFYVDVPEGTEQFNVSITGDGDADLYASYQNVAHYYDYQTSNFGLGSDEVIEFQTQANGLVAPGRYYFSLTARESFRAVEVKTYAKSKSAQLADERAPIVVENSQANVLTINQVRYAGLYVNRPGIVRVWLTGKQTDQSPVSVFVGLEGWASMQQYDFSTQGQGINQYLEFEVEKPGHVHFTLSAQQPNSVVELFTAY